MPTQIIGFALGLLSLLGAAAQVDAHAFMVRARPAVGSKVISAPTEVQIWFSEPLQQASSTIQVFDGNGKQIDKKDTHLDRVNRALVHVSLPAGLGSGTYKVTWRVTSIDTHITTGDFRFQINR
jgi:methionine-rich copper-binding protein CopC